MFRSCEFLSPWLDVDASGNGPATRTRDLYYDLPSACSTRGEASSLCNHST